MTRRKRKGRKRKSRNDSILIPSLLTLFCTSAVGLFVYYYIFHVDDTIYDESSLCPESGAAGALTVLIDTSDPISVVQKDLVSAWLQEDIAMVPAGTLISVSSLGVENTTSFQVCKPINPEDVSMIADNPRIRAEVFSEKFQVPLEATLQNMMVADGADTSPIMESVLPTILRSEARVRSDESKTLVVISDMIQNSENFSFFKGGTWASFEQSEKFKRLGSNLSGYRVKLYLIPRERYSQINQETIQEFWRRYFDHQGVDRVSLRRLGDL